MFFAPFRARVREIEQSISFRRSKPSLLEQLIKYSILTLFDIVLLTLFSFSVRFLLLTGRGSDSAACFLDVRSDLLTIGFRFVFFSPDKLALFETFSDFS